MSPKTDIVAPLRSASGEPILDADMVRCASGETVEAEIRALQQQLAELQEQVGPRLPDGALTLDGTAATALSLDGTLATVICLGSA